MRVALVGHSYLAPENRKYLTALARLVDLEVYSPDRTQDLLFTFATRERIIQGDGWALRAYPRIGLPGFPRAQYVLSGFAADLRRFAPDVLHVEADPWTPIFVQMALAQRVAAPRAKVVCTIKQNTYTRHNAAVCALKDLLARTFVPSVSRFIAVNEAVKGIYRSRFGVGDDRFASNTHLGVDTGLFAPVCGRDKPGWRRALGLPTEGVLIGYCGRFAADKGVEDLVEAAEELVGCHRDAALVLLGDGPLRETLTVKSEGRRWLHIRGTVPHPRVAEFMKCLDIFVMPARVTELHVEHDAHAVIEAMACGLPCVGTNSGAIPEVLGDCGLRTEPGKPHALAQALQSLVGSARLRVRLGAAARHRVGSLYSNEAVARTNYRVYCEVVGEGLCG